MKVLILTDHSAHHVTNSFYGIANAILANRSVTGVGIASRGDQRNAGFFSGGTSTVMGLNINFPIDFQGFDLLVKSAKELELSQFDVVLLRIPRPVSTHFFPMLTELFKDKQIVNSPNGIVKTGNKAFLTTLDAYVPPCIVCNSWQDVLDFGSQFPIVLKPLEEYGGKGLMRLNSESGWIGSAPASRDEIMRAFISVHEPMLAMKYMKNVHMGDKRIIVAGGEILTTSIRFPAKGGWLCNVSQGGSPTFGLTDQRDFEIVKYLEDVLDGYGIFSYGIDTLVDDDGLRVISELNTLSVGGIMPAEEATGLPYSRIFADRFVEYCLENESDRHI